LPPNAAELIYPITNSINGRKEADLYRSVGEVIYDAFIVTFTESIDKPLMGASMYRNVIRDYIRLLMSNSFINSLFRGDVD